MGNVEDEEEMRGLRVQEEERILVSIRLRPLNEKEASRNEAIDWECADDHTILYKNQSFPERSLYPLSYTFDRVFGNDCSTRQVYDEGAKAVVLSVLSGINSSVLVYGQTSSGKTYTISGITKYTMADIYDYIHKHEDREFHLKFSAMEIYNELVRDLLIADHSPLRVLDEPENGTVVENLSEETLRDWDHFKELLAICEAQRQIGETFLNKSSSQSHQILRLTVESSTREFMSKDNCSNHAATLTFVDLAGSEHASEALSAGSRLKKGSHVNRSLLTLGTVICKLSKGQTGHIPYQDSNLTRILQTFFGGNARTSIICTMSPAQSNVEQSRNTLLFASHAKEVTTYACGNVVMSDKALVKHQQRELAILEDELSASPSSESPSTILLREKDFKIDELERRVKELTLQLDLAQSQIHNLQQGVEEQKPAIWDGNSAYPRLVVRQASENSFSESDISVVEHQSFDADSPSFEAPKSPDRHSRLSCKENYSTSDLDDNLSPSSPSERRFIEAPSFSSRVMQIQKPIGVRDVHPTLSEGSEYIVPDGTGGESPNSLESDMRHISEESKEVSDTYENSLLEAFEEYGSQPPCCESNPLQVSNEPEERTCNSEEVEKYLVSEQNLDIESIYNDIDPQRNSDATKVQIDETLENHCEENQRVEFKNLQVNAVPPEEDKKSSVITDFENDSCTYDPPKQEHELELVNSSSLEDPVEPYRRQLMNDTVASSSSQENIVCEIRIESENEELEFVNSSSLEDPKELSSRQLMNEEVECQYLIHKSSSQSHNMSASSSSQEDMNCEIRDESEDEEHVIKFKDIQRKLSALKYDTDDRALQESVAGVKLKETQASKIGDSSHLDTVENYRSLRKDYVKAKSLGHLQFRQSQGEDSHQKTNDFTKNVEDVLNPQVGIDDSSPCPSDVARLQKEIIELWDACNTSLVHRTCFFLLFIKDDQADAIYMEVERRRLSHIQDAFLWGKSIILDGHQFTPSSSRRLLHNERKMLSKLMKRRLSSQERKDLYTRWDIALNSKKRRSQLINRLWVNTLDMDHVMESANVVAKLVQFSEPHVPKEVFGLNLKANKAKRKSFGWKHNPSHFMKNTFSKVKH